MDASELSPDLLASEREVAIRLARNQVVIQLAIVAACSVAVAVAGPGHYPDVVIGVGVMAAAAALYDARWWIWLRDAEPAEAYTRLQQRPEFETFLERTRLRLVLPLVILGLWWWLRKS